MDLPPSKGVCSSTQGRIFSVWQGSAGIGLFNVIIHHVTPKSAFKKPRRCPRVRAVHETGGADHGRITDQKSCAQQIRREKDGCEICGCKMKVQYQRCAGGVMRCHARAEGNFVAQRAARSRRCTRQSAVPGFNHSSMAWKTKNLLASRFGGRKVCRCKSGCAMVEVCHA
jgi:hypothetical protein